MFDMKDLARLKKLDENAPEAMRSFLAFDRSAFADGALSVQQKQISCGGRRVDHAVPILHRAAYQAPPTMQAPAMSNWRKPNLWLQQSGQDGSNACHAPVPRPNA